MKGQKGITLVALIITIIVLLILAVVAITSIQNSKIVPYAQNASTKYTTEKGKEDNTLKEYENYLNNETTKIK